MNQISKNKYDLEDRTAVLGENIIKFCKTLKEDTISRPLISQIIRSSTSIGANYMEATGGSSKKDFLNKIFICKKETQETKHWLRMLAVCFPDNKKEIRDIWKECQELTLIFSKIVSSGRNSNKKIEN